MQHSLNLAPYKAFIETLVASSGAIIRDYFQSDLEVIDKDDATPVTEADKKAEVVIRELIAKKFPSHGVLGEEYGLDKPDAEWCWVLDPVDGTKSFIAGSYDFGTIIGLTYQGQPVLGAVHQPVLNELFIGDNETTTCNGEVVRVDNDVKLEQVIVLASDLDNISRLQNAEGYARLAQQIKFSRTWGNCFGYCMVARGVPAIMIDPRAAVWDITGVIPIIRGAGGVITTYQGNDPMEAGSGVACAPSIHAQVIELLN